MLGEMTADEVELLNAYQILRPAGQKDLKDYMRYLLYKQYKREVITAVFHNRLLRNLLHSLLYMTEKDDFHIQSVKRRVQQIKELYYSIFEQVHCRYSEVIEDLDSSELVREFARNSFYNLERALQGKNLDIIRCEIIDFYQQYNRLSQKEDTRKIVAV